MRVLRRFLVGIALVIGATTSAPADVVLHPGYVTGTSGLTNWTFSNGSVYLSSPSGFSGSASVAGTAGAAYQVAVEGGQTYTSLGQSFSTNNGSFSTNRPVNLAVPVGGTIANQNLLTPGGTVQVNVSAATDPGASATIVNFYFFATATNDAATESYAAYAYYGPTPILLPMGAASTVSVGGYYVTFQLTDTSANVCYVSQSLSGTALATVTVAEGQTAVVDQSFDLSGKTCPPPGSGTIRGTVTLNNVPSGLTPTTARVAASGPASASADISSAFAPASAPVPYVFANIAAGSYYMQAYASFGSGSLISYVNLAPNGGANYVTLNNGDDVTRDFTYDVGAVQGAFSVTGPLASALTSAASNGYAYASSYFTPASGSSTDPNYGSNGGFYLQGYGGQSLPAFPAPYATALPAGQWVSPGFSAQAYSNTDTLYLSVYDYTAASSPLVVSAGATTANDVTIATSQGDLVFDVAQPGINLSYPSVNISNYDPVAGRSVSISAQSYALNKDTTTVKVIGPPGQYPFTAYAYVGADCSSTTTPGCSYATFPPGSVTLGQASNTPVGTNEQVTLLDANGNPFGVQLTFDNVTSAGQTNGAYTSQGPTPPGAFTLMPAFNGATYLSITTTATFSGNVLIALKYNPAALGLNAQTEALLQLWHYKCDSTGTSCQWEFINGGHSPDPDTTNHVIYGVTSSFSVFALLLPPVVTSTPPTLSLTVSPNNLWPPNHKMVPIAVHTTASDTTDPNPQVTCSATSPQANDGDIVWANGKLSLRAERAGNGGDRVYTISCTAKNVAGLTTTKTATVTVPHDQR